MYSELPPDMSICDTEFPENPEDMLGRTIIMLTTRNKLWQTGVISQYWKPTVIYRGKVWMFDVSWFIKEGSRYNTELTGVTLYKECFNTYRPKPHFGDWMLIRVNL